MRTFRIQSLITGSLSLYHGNLMSDGNQRQVFWLANQPPGAFPVLQPVASCPSSSLTAAGPRRIYTPLPYQALAGTVICLFNCAVVVPHLGEHLYHDAIWRVNYSSGPGWQLRMGGLCSSYLRNGARLVDEAVFHAEFRVPRPVWGRPATGMGKGKRQQEVRLNVEIDTAGGFDPGGGPGRSVRGGSVQGGEYRPRRAASRPARGRRSGRGGLPMLLWRGQRGRGGKNSQGPKPGARTDEALPGAGRDQTAAMTAPPMADSTTTSQGGTFQRVSSPKAQMPRVKSSTERMPLSQTVL